MLTLLTACGQTPPPEPVERIVFRERLIFAEPDPSLRLCLARPVRPVLTDGRDTAVLIVNLDERGEDCAAKLAATWQSIDDARARAEAANRAAGADQAPE